jgi:hypothetical protein
MYAIHHANEITSAIWEFVTSAYKAGYHDLKDFHTFGLEQMPLQTETSYSATVSAIAVRTTGISSMMTSLPTESDFASVAHKYGIDETTIEDYDLLVKRYIQPLQDSRLRMLDFIRAKD